MLNTPIATAPATEDRIDSVAMQDVAHVINEKQCTRSVPLFHENANTDSEEDGPPNGGYAWICTICVFLINAHTWGVNSTWGVILDYFLEHESFPNAKPLEYALIGGLSLAQSMMISPVAGISREHLGTRSTLLIGTIVVSASLFASAYATKLWHLFLSQGVCYGWGMGFLYITATTVLPNWFSTHRSLAVGLATSGAGLGGLAYNLIAERTIQTLGVAWTYRIVAICTLVANTFSSFFLRDRTQRVTKKPAPETETPGPLPRPQPAQQPQLSQQPQPQPARPSKEKPARSRLLGNFDLRALRRIEVLLVIFWGVTTELGYIALYYSLPNYASSIGLSPSQGAAANALLNLGLALGRPVVGYYSDALGRINMSTLMTLFCGVVCLALWIPARGFPALAAFAALAGTACGTFWGTVAPVLAEVVGIEAMAGVFGLVCFAMVLPTMFAEPIAMHLVGEAGEHAGVRRYLAAQLFVGVAYLAGAVSLLLLRAWKIGEIERQEELVQRAEGPLHTRLRFAVPRRAENSWTTLRRVFLPKKV
ncbi:major facilitator superfamily domain-containing protein [Macrophomina phaseolina]|uniref:Major facilitator superfamily domain-containing protein n=1 Tax=Macrophomina phaseolina TaxID=35725 RepID=A0ABQ8G566_9PEZI|nr:major facilitator superfamily domain-containing protein [Macrophomina phaseolina]